MASEQVETGAVFERQFDDRDIDTALADQRIALPAVRRKAHDISAPLEIVVELGGGISGKTDQRNDWPRHEKSRSQVRGCN
ncbi:hypothetical protein MesoLjLc_23360 [Mesorhizobium sp. L-8-10]|nr:hypothetical protein MesoLjLb_23890 [Mesorhizobium sp. L-8-3]BCH30406.1 hypothetical protein MesoLjLc_23360 [Mesorhizobium sp. L-8-10]